VAGSGFDNIVTVLVKRRDRELTRLGIGAQDEHKRLKFLGRHTRDNYWPGPEVLSPYKLSPSVLICSDGLYLLR
jgi:hypothetical protein